jgi:SAM-dependent methyltransferase
MAEERATQNNPYWSYRYGIVPTPGQRYLTWRHRLCAPHVRGRHVLDVPSGEGLGLGFFRAARSVTCLDYDLGALQRCAGQTGTNIRAIRGSMTALPLPSESYDCVTSLEGLEHLDKRDGVRFLSEVSRVLRPAGSFLLSCPISTEGRHSGNAFHRHEWSWRDLQAMLALGFEIAQSEITETFAGSAVWCRLTRRPRQADADDWLAQLRSQGQARLQDAFARQRDWVGDAFDGHDQCGLWKGGERSLLPTGFGVMAADTAGLRLPSDTRDAIISTLRAQQLEDGFFDPGPIRRNDLTSHSATYLRMQATYFAIHALDALGARPRHRVALVARLHDVSYLRGWLDGGPWRNPWLHSNTVMFALTFLQTDAVWCRNAASMTAFDAILDYLDERQDPATGLWQPDDGVDVPNAVYAAYHFFPYYFWRGRRPRFIPQIIDATLSIQQADGLFGGGACEDLDAVHTLIMMSLVSAHRAADVRMALERCFWRMLQIQQADGGFRNYAGRARAPKSRKRRLAEQTGVLRLLPSRFREATATSSWYYSGWKALDCPRDASDMWGSWFRPLALRLIAERYADLCGEPPAGRYRTLPGLGWHDITRIQDSL